MGSESLVPWVSNLGDWPKSEIVVVMKDKLLLTNVGLLFLACQLPLTFHTSAVCLLAKPHHTLS